MSELNHYRPDQPYGQLDILTQAVADAVADGYTDQPERLLAEFAWLECMVKRLVEGIPTSELPSGLPPKLRQLLYGVDANDTPPPDIPQ